jgi:AraC family transcriptional regulator
MHKRFLTFRDYHAGDPGITARHLDLPHLRVSHLAERDGDVKFLRTDRSGIVLTLDGSSRHLTRMDGIADETPSRPGEVSFIPEGVDIHVAWQNHGDIQHSLMIDFDHAVFETYAPEVAGSRLSRGVLVPSNYAERPVMAGLIRLLAREIDPAQRRGRIFAETVIRLIALELAASHWSVPVRDLDAPSHRDARVQRAIDFVEANFARDISLIEISAVAGLSPTHLTTVFQRETGFTPYAYVIERRLREAVKMLRATDLPIAQVAFATGFADQQHMTRVFRARLGTTPRSVRVG